MKPPLEKVRLDKWLWAVRLFKTRALAKQAVEGGKVHLEGQKTKPGKEITTGVTLQVRVGFDIREIVVAGLVEKRVGAPIALEQYTETPESLAEREKLQAMRRLNKGADILHDHRPNKKERRQIHRFKRVNQD